VFNISDNCWKSSHNLWTSPNHNSRSLEGLGFRACYSASAQYPTARFETQTFWGNYSRVFSLRWRINHFALNLLSWVCLNIIKINKYDIFVLTLYAKFAVTKILVHLRLNLTQPYQTSSSWALLLLQFRWKFICLHVFR